MKSIVKDGFLSLAYSITSRASLLLANLIAVKLLSVHDYGIFSVYLTIVTSIATLSTFGLGVTCNKISAASSLEDPEFVKAVVFGSTLISIVLALLVVGTYWPLVQADFLNTLGEPLAFFSIIAVAWFISVTSVFEGTLFGTRNYRKLLNNALFSTAISIPLMGFAAKMLGIQGAIAATVFSRALIMLMHLASLYRRGWIGFNAHLIRTRSFEIKKAIFQTSLPLALSGVLAGPTIALALSMVVDRHGPTSAGYFAWPYQIYLVATFIPGALGHFLTSRLSRKGNISNIKILQMATIVYLSLAIITCALMMLFKNQILGLAGHQFITQAADIYYLFSLCTILYALNVGYISYWTSINRAWIQFVAQAVWSVSLIIVIVTNLDAKGAAAIPYGFVVAYTIQAIIQYMLIIFKKDLR